jgi:hypothetical protein
LNRQFKHFKISAVGTNVHVGVINGKSSLYPSFPPLTQPENIQESTFCDYNTIAEYCDPGTPCHCIHRIKIKTGSIVEMVLIDGGLGNKNEKI